MPSSTLVAVLKVVTVGNSLFCNPPNLSGGVPNAAGVTTATVVGKGEVGYGDGMVLKLFILMMAVNHDEMGIYMLCCKRVSWYGVVYVGVVLFWSPEGSKEERKLRVIGFANTHWFSSRECLSEFRDDSLPNQSYTI